MTFRTRLVLISALAVAAAVVVASAFTYVLVRDEPRRGRRGTAGTSGDHRLGSSRIPRRDDGFSTIPRRPARRGARLHAARDVDRDDDPAARRRRRARSASATGRRPKAVRDRSSRMRVAGTHVRADAAARHGYALQIARPLDEVDNALARIRNWLLLIAALGVVFAAALGLVVARAVRRCAGLTRTAEDVTETRDLSRRIEVTGRDELSRLASTFNTMLAALEDSSHAQRQLVSDASHELRTPLTSLRTNIEVLARDDELPSNEREELLLDVTDQLTEMTALVAELMELARGDQSRRSRKMSGSISSSRPRSNGRPAIRPGVRFGPGSRNRSSAAFPRRSSALSRICSTTPRSGARPGGEIEVGVHDGEVTVRDHGPGIDAADAPFVFDRFYRAPGPRPAGLGLGLAIVRRVRRMAAPSAPRRPRAAARACG